MYHEMLAGEVGLQEGGLWCSSWQFRSGVHRTGFGGTRRRLKQYVWQFSAQSLDGELLVMPAWRSFEKWFVVSLRRRGCSENAGYVSVWHGQSTCAHRASELV